MDEELKNSVQTPQKENADAEFDSIIQSVPAAVQKEPEAKPVQRSVVKPQPTADPSRQQTVNKKKKKKKKKKRRKKKSIGRIVWDVFKTIILVAIILVVIGVGLGIYVFIGMSSESCTTDSITKLIKADPLTCAERFDIDPDTLTAKLSMDKADLWWLLTKTYGDDVMEELKDSFTDRGLRLAGYGINIDEEESSADLDIRWNGIKFVAHVPLEFSFDDSTLTVTPQSMRFLSFKLGPKLFKFLTKADITEKTYSVELKSCGFIKNFDSFEIIKDKLVFGVTLDPGILKAIAPSEGYPAYVYYFSEGFGELADAAETYAESPQNAFKQLFKSIENENNGVERILSEYYTLAEMSKVRSQLTEADGFILERVLGGYDIDSLNQSHDALIVFCDARKAITAELVDSVTDAYNGLKITLNKSGQFIYKKNLLDASLFASKDNPWEYYELFMSSESIIPVLVSADDAWTAKTPQIRRLISVYDIFTLEGVEKNDIYPIGLVFDTVKGDHVLVYKGFEEGADPETQPVFVNLAEDELNKVKAAVNEGKIFIFPLKSE